MQAHRRTSTVPPLPRPAALVAAHGERYAVTLTDASGRTARTDYR